MMTHAMQAIKIYENVGRDKFEHEIRGEYRPAVLRGLVKNWPAVRAAMRSPSGICDYFGNYDNGSDVEVILIPPKFGRRQFYDENMDGFTNIRNSVPIAAVIDQLLRYAKFDNPPSVAVQGALLDKCMPGFLGENPMPLLDRSIAPRLWFGNSLIVPTHMDELSNVACVVSGKRRFTLFPPDQISNLYIGPLEYTPSGPPISMVTLDEPDFESYPRFKDALAAAQFAELEPGDAIYMPAFWYHHVESVQQFNTLITYWWRDAAAIDYKAGFVSDCLYYCLLNLKHLPAEHRRAVGAMFNHYIFDSAADPAEHIPAEKRGILGDVSAAQADHIKNLLAKKLMG